MSIFDGDPSDPLYRFAARTDVFDEVMEVVRSVVIGGRTWKYYRVEILKRYLQDGKHEYLAAAYVEDHVDAERVAASGAVARGSTRYWTRWTTFPDVRQRSAAAALEEALELLAERAL